VAQNDKNAFITMLLTMRTPRDVPIILHRHGVPLLLTFHSIHHNGPDVPHHGPTDFLIILQLVPRDITEGMCSLLCPLGPVGINLDPTMWWGGMGAACLPNRPKKMRSNVTLRCSTTNCYTALPPWQACMLHSWVDS